MSARTGFSWTMSALSVIAAALVMLPLAGLILQAPWLSLVTHLRQPGVVAALRLSTLSSFAALALATVLGVPLAWVLARREFRGKSVLRALVVLPMVLPPVVGGVALLLAFGRSGLVGSLLDRLTGIRLPFTTAGTILAATFVAMPFLVVTAEAGFRAMDSRYEQAAATLGANRWTTFRHVTVPLIAPSLAAGMALTWARALGEFGATITFAGNRPGVTQTMPLAVYLALETDPGAAYALSIVLAGVSMAVLLVLRGRFFRSS